MGHGRKRSLGSIIPAAAIATVSSILFLGCEEKCAGEPMASDQAAYAVLRNYVLSKRKQDLDKIGVTPEALARATPTLIIQKCPSPRRRYFVQRINRPDGTPEPLWVVFQEYVQAECPECWHLNTVHASGGPMWQHL